MTDVLLCAVIAAVCVIYAVWPGVAERYAASCEPRPLPEPDPAPVPRDPSAAWACREWRVPDGQVPDGVWLAFQLYGTGVCPDQKVA